MGKVKELKAGLGKWFRWYNQERPHQTLGYKTPGEVYLEEKRDLPDAA